MNTPHSVPESVASLLAQDRLLNSETFDEHRRKVVQRLDEARQREKKARRLVLALLGGCIALFLALYAVTVHQISTDTSWPDWAREIIALIVILSPLTLLLLSAIYLFRYVRPLLQAKKHSQTQTLAELSRQVDELRRELQQVREQLTANQASQKSPSPGEKAFTLAEILVVVVVLMIVASLLFPMLARAKGKARTASCQNNLRQMGQALALYEGDYGYYPGGGDSALKIEVYPWAVTSPESWVTKLNPYLSKSESIFFCPNDKRTADFGPMKQESYGYNATGSSGVHNLSSQLGLGTGKTNFVQSSDLKQPSDMIAIGDLQLHRQVWLAWITPHKTQMGNINTLIPFRHAGGANMVFADTHVQWAKYEFWAAAESSARSRWNNDHQPHPETW